jgi:hypothetical protein
MTDFAATLMFEPACGAPLHMVQVAPGIYVHPGVHEDANVANEDAIANIGFIVGDAVVMVIDPGGSALEGQSLREAVAIARSS